MPKIAIYKFLIFYIFAFDALNEPPHLHITKEKGRRQRSAKIWLYPIEVSDKGSLTEKELTLALRIMTHNQQTLLDSFNKIKAGKKITTLILSK